MLAERTGLEPATPGVTGRYSNQLNYRSVYSDRYFDRHRDAWWALRGSNSRPNPCKGSALPTELSAHLGGFYLTLVIASEEARIIEGGFQGLQGFFEKNSKISCRPKNRGPEGRARTGTSACVVIKTSHAIFTCRCMDHSRTIPLLTSRQP